MERLFENNEETYRLLKSRMLDAGWEVSVQFLPAAEQPTRFSPSPALVHLERHVLGQIHPVPCPDDLWNQVKASEPQGNGATPGAANDHIVSAPIELIEASDRRSEVEAIARRIADLCRREDASFTPEASNPKPMITWREVAVLARDLEPYEPHIHEVFTLFEIPFFLDRPRQIEGHPLARLTLSALVVLRSGWSGDAILRHLKCGLCALKDENAIALLENHILATDPHGSYWREQVEKDPTLREFWRQAAGPLRHLESALHEGVRPARALWSLLEEVGAAATLEGWIQQARQAGQEEAVQIHEQAWEQTIQWLEEFEDLSATIPDLLAQGGDPSQSFRERVQDLIELVESALSSIRARLIPPTLNQVTVGSVDRSRTPEVKVAFVMGLNDGEFPRAWSPDPILGDEDRDNIVRHGRRLGPDTPRKRMQEHFLAYIALTRAAERLVLTRPMTDDEGRVCDPSPYFRMVARNFPLAPRRVVRRAGEQDHPAMPLRPEEWALRLSMALGRIEDLGRASALAAAVASGVLLNHPHLTPHQRHGLELARLSLLTPTVPRLGENLALEFWRDQASLPVTALEMYGECPFKFFAMQMLRLAERKEARLSGMDLGTIRHEILDRLFVDLRAGEGLAWGLIDLAQSDSLIDRHLERIRRHPQWASRLEASSLGHLALEQLGGEMKLLVRALHLAGERCRLTQVESEWKFGRDEELIIQAPPVKFSIRGKIDRIDAVPLAQPGSADQPQTYILIDYKSGARRLNLGRLMEGLDLQLLTYALAYKQVREQNGHPRLRIGGIFYWPLSAPVKDAEPEEPLDAPLVDERWFGKRAPSGLFEEDLFSVLDTRVGPNEKALLFGFQLTKDGALNKRGQSHWPQGSMNLLLEHERLMLRKWAGMISHGEIGNSPIIQAKAEACDNCLCQGACRKAAPQATAWRRIKPLKRDDVLAMLGAIQESHDKG